MAQIRNTTPPRYRKDSRYFRILEEVHAGDLTIGLLLSGGSVRHMGRIAYQRARERYENRRALERLQACGYVSSKSHRGASTYFITPAGKRALHEAYLEASSARARSQKQWDGSWRVLSYDLPENKRSSRNSLRYVLEKSGFLQVQKSVWIFPYDAPKLERALAEHPDIRGNVMYFQTRKFSGDAVYRKAFKL